MPPSEWHKFYTALVAALPGALFGLLADLPHYGRWLPGSQQFDQTTDVAPYPVQLAGPGHHHACHHAPPPQTDRQQLRQGKPADDGGGQEIRRGAHRRRIWRLDQSKNLPGYQATGPLAVKCPPVGPSGPIWAIRTMISAPSPTVWVPVRPLRSVAV
jgi:hypothetical protein